MFKYWVQKANFETIEGFQVSVDEAIMAFTDHDWDAELRIAERMNAGGADVCDPGIGFVSVDPASDLLLHICPKSWERAAITYQYPADRSKLFGLISRAPVVATAYKCDVAMSDVRIAIELYICKEHSPLLDFLK